jgi:lipoate-protein ligase A
MATDEALLEAAASLSRPVLRFYSWTEPAASFGYSQAYAEIARWTNLRPLIRRPTGGGLVPHDADWTYSLVFPANHPWHRLKAVESYRRVHEWLQHAFACLGVAASLSSCCQRSVPGQCFVGAEQFDLLHTGRKIAGAAQRRNRLGLLIQGSVQPAGILVKRDDWENAMLQRPPFVEKIDWAELRIEGNLRQRIEDLVREKYGQASYNERR